MSKITWEELSERAFAKVRAEIASCHQEPLPMTEERRVRLAAVLDQHRKVVVELTAALDKLREPIGSGRR